MRIGLFTDYYVPHQGGVESAVTTYAQALKDRGHEVVIICPSYPGYSNDEPNVIRLKAIPKLSVSEHPQVFPTRRNQKIIAQQHFDIVHSHSLAGVSLLGAWYATTFQVPFISTFHFNTSVWIDLETLAIIKYGVSGFLYKWFVHMARHLHLRHRIIFQNQPSPRYNVWQWRRMLIVAPFANRLVVPSRHFMDELQKYYPEGKYALTPNAVDVKRYKPRFSDSGKTIRFLWVGRMAPEKRPLQFLEAVRLFSKTNHKSFAVDMVGSGPQLKAAQTFVAQHNLQNVWLHGGLPYHEVVGFYQNADVLVLSSDKVDNQPMVLAEASASGLSVVLCDKLLVNQLYSDGYHLAGSASPNDLAKAMELALHKKTPQSATPIVEFAKSHYDLKILGARLDKLYKEAVA